MKAINETKERDRIVYFCNSIATLSNIPLRFEKCGEGEFNVIFPRKILKDIKLANYYLYGDRIKSVEYNSDIFIKYVDKIRAMLDLYKIISIGFSKE